MHIWAHDHCTVSGLELDLDVVTAVACRLNGLANGRLESTKVPAVDDLLQFMSPCDNQPTQLRSLD